MSEHSVEEDTGCPGCGRRPCVCETVVLPTAESDAGDDACRVINVGGSPVRVHGEVDDWDDSDHAAFGEVIAAARAKHAAANDRPCTCSPYFGSCDYSPTCARHGRVIPPAEGRA